MSKLDGRGSALDLARISFRRLPPLAAPVPLSPGGDAVTLEERAESAEWEMLGGLNSEAWAGEGGKGRVQLSELTLAEGDARGQASYAVVLASVAKGSTSDGDARGTVRLVSVSTLLDGVGALRADMSRPMPSTDGVKAM